MMWGVPQGHVYLVGGVTDMRKSIDGLALLVAEELELNPVCPNCFVFCNRGKDKLKILQFDVNGFWLHYKRLENSRFVWPRDVSDQTAVQVTVRQLRWLLDGLEWHKAIAHQPLSQREVR
ncbi:MAG: IS66 Orf2 like protein [Glomeribacter sp. 1016415]|nr:IS66 Orf2 like protein [Glomeribacter sp. 1016415]MCX8567242.1 IS66 Orf2 like protein [Glomeribacter sp. 1016415]